MSALPEAAFWAVPGKCPRSRIWDPGNLSAHATSERVLCHTFPGSAYDAIRSLGALTPSRNTQDKPAAGRHSASYLCRYRTGNGNRVCALLHSLGDGGQDSDTEQSVLERVGPSSSLLFLSACNSMRGASAHVNTVPVWRLLQGPGAMLSRAQIGPEYPDSRIQYWSGVLQLQESGSQFNDCQRAMARRTISVRKGRRLRQTHARFRWNNVSGSRPVAVATMPSEVIAKARKRAGRIVVQHFQQAPLTAIGTSRKRALCLQASQKRPRQGPVTVVSSASL